MVIPQASGLAFVLRANRKLRLSKFWSAHSLKERNRLIKEVTSLVLARRSRLCNFIDYKDSKIVYKRYASLFFVALTSLDENELLALETMHRYVETLDRYFGNVCELDLIFGFQKAYNVLDELIVGGRVAEPSMKAVLRAVQLADELETEELEDHKL